MSCRELGNPVDIHGGGWDLQFPHHENEIAQSECANRGHALAKVWMHNGFLQVEGEKMSKSLGNFVTIRDLLDGKVGSSSSPDVLRFNMLRTHYRQPINWADASVSESFGVLKSLYENFNHVPNDKISNLPKVFVDALEDDLNLPEAITELHELKRRGETESLYSAIRFLGLSGIRENVTHRVSTEIKIPLESGRHAVTGFSARMFVIRADGSIETDPETVAYIQKSIEARNAARKARDFKEADRIRDELLKQGIQLNDSPSGTTWEVKR
jgi:cysteinyl-tRNA synthetase